MWGTYVVKNMRLWSGTNPIECLEIENFKKWLLEIGEGKISEPNDVYAEIDIPSEILISSFDDSIKAIVDSTYQSFFWIIINHTTTSKVDLFWLQPLKL